MKNNLKRMVACGMVLCMAAVPVMAATAEEAVIDPSKTGSLTIHKYDMTAAGLDGITESPTATGQTDAAVEAAYGSYAVEGVEFTYLKVADIITYSETQADGVDKIQVGYEFGSSDTLLSLLGISRSDTIQEDKGAADAASWYLSSDTLIDQMEGFQTADPNDSKNQLENYVKDNGGTAMELTDTFGITSADQLDLGLYLIVETKVPEQVTDTVAPFFVSLPMTTNDGDSWNYDATVYPKNQSGMPTLEKLVAEVTTGELAATGHISSDPAYAPTATASDGDLLYYQITSRLPVIHSEATYLTTYTFLDTLSKGIEYNPNDVALNWYTDPACENCAASWAFDSGKFTVSYGTAAGDASTMTISMTADGLQEINTLNDTNSATNYGEYYVRISYSAVVNSSADVTYGETGNPNDVVLTWKRTSMDYFDELKDECVVYTFGLDITKSFSDGQGSFSDVSFKVKNSSDDYYLIADKASDGVYYVTGEACKTADEEAATVFVPNAADGTLMVYGLEDDTYRITELTTANGYTLLKEDIQVVIETNAADVNFAQNGENCGDGSIGSLGL